VPSDVHHGVASKPFFAEFNDQDGDGKLHGDVAEPIRKLASRISTCFWMASESSCSLLGSSISGRNGCFFAIEHSRT